MLTIKRYLVVIFFIISSHITFAQYLDLSLKGGAVGTILTPASPTAKSGIGYDFDFTALRIGNRNWYYGISVTAEEICTRVTLLNRNSSGTHKVTSVLGYPLAYGFEFQGGLKFGDDDDEHRIDIGLNSGYLYGRANKDWVNNPDRASKIYPITSGTVFVFGVNFDYTKYLRDSKFGFGININPEIFSDKFFQKPFAVGLPIRLAIHLKV